MILITGATGTIGRALIRELAGRGVPLRALSRDAGRTRNLIDPRVEVVGGDFGDPASLLSALRGADKCFLLTATTPNRLAHERNFLMAAKEARIGHVVRLSISGADPLSPCRIMRDHGLADRSLLESGIPCTLLRANYFMQNLLWYAGSIKAAGLFNTAFPAEALHAHIDAGDIAASAAAALTGDGHVGQAYRLTGPAALSFRAVAGLLTDALGRTVRYDDSTADFIRLMRSWGLGGEGFAELDHHIGKRMPDGAAETDAVQRLTGRAPIPYKRFLEENLANFSQ